MAQLWKLPIVYVIVNNQTGMGTKVEAASAEPELYKRACAYRMASDRVDGNDLLAVRDATRRAVDRARSESLPTLLEAVSFRLRGHSVVDPARYRSKEEVERGRAQDPVAAFRARLLQAGILDEAGVAALDAEVERELQQAIDFADASPDPSVEELFDDVYATPVANAPRALPGDPVWR
jgi:pyruvate dehydrogenase E1 component alpha subunit